MSLLNRPSDGTHSVLIVIYKLLSQEGAMHRDKIIGLCTPPPLNKGTMVGATLNTWIEFGLFDELSGGNITLGRSIPKNDHSLENLPWLARRLALHENNNPDLWSNEKSRAGDCTRALAWLLAQDVYAVSLAGWSGAESLLMKQLPASLRTGKENGLIQNDTRWTGLKAWSTWLGFAWLGRHPKDVLMIDPTVAIRDALPSVFGKKQTLPASEVVEGLADLLPVLDGGKYRKKVEAKLADNSGADAWRPPPDDQLSTSFSRALLRLKESGTVVLDHKDDAKDRISLTGREHRVVQKVSHISFKS